MVMRAETKEPIVEFLNNSDIMIKYRPDYDDLEIQEGSFCFFLEREEFDVLRNFLNKINSKGKD